MASLSRDMRMQQDLTESKRAGPSYQPSNYSPPASPLQKAGKFSGYHANSTQMAGSRPVDVKTNGVHQNQRPEAASDPSSQFMSSLTNSVMSPQLPGPPLYSVISPQPLRSTSPDAKPSTSLPWQVTSAKRQLTGGDIVASGHGSVRSIGASDSHIQIVEQSSGQYDLQPSVANQVPTRSYTPPPKQQWTISAYPPPDPRDAFAIMISPNARPPSHIVSRAVVIPSPAKSRSYPSASAVDLASSDHTAVVKGEPFSPDLKQQPIPRPSTTSSTPRVVMPGSPSSNQTFLPSVPDTGTVLTNSGIEDEGSSIAEPASPKVAPPYSTPVKKSWASLLRDNGAVTLTPKNNFLPTSTVVGFSIPANSAVTAIQNTSTDPKKQTSLLSLLTLGADVSEPIGPIHPRGLVNTGNICFANVVLQVLVYCTPFHCLFSSLGRFLNEGGDDRSDEASLVKAMVRFFHEFKPRSEGETGSEEIISSDSFIPSYVYEALKDKRRFDNLRVSLTT